MLCAALWGFISMLCAALWGFIKRHTLTPFLNNNPLLRECFVDFYNSLEETVESEGFVNASLGAVMANVVVMCMPYYGEPASYTLPALVKGDRIIADFSVPPKNAPAKYAAFKGKRTEQGIAWEDGNVWPKGQHKHQD